MAEMMLSPELVELRDALAKIRAGRRCEIDANRMRSLHYFGTRGRHIGRPWPPQSPPRPYGPTTALDGGLSYGKPTDMSHCANEGDLLLHRLLV